MYDKERPRIIRITLEFIHTIGNMYFIGLFYKGTTAEGSNFSDVIAGYTIQDFVIIIYSNLIMIFIVTLCKLISKTKAIDNQQPTTVVLALIKKNNTKKLAGLLIGWTSLGYFIWSIVLFALQFPEQLSYKWVFNSCNTIFMKYFIWSLAKIASKVFVIVPLNNRFKKRKPQVSYSQIVPDNQVSK